MDVFKALADPTRREIIKMLNDKNYTAGEISAHFTMSKPAISKHLEILKGAELIASEKQGQYVLYSINTSAVQNLICSMMELFEQTVKDTINEEI